MKTKSFSHYIQRYFSYIHFQRGYAKNTISSYADAILSFLLFLRKQTGKNPESLCFDDISREQILAFCDWLESEKKVSIRTRNHRLAVLHAFFQFLQYETPVYLELCQSILSIPMKKTPKTIPQYLSTEEMKMLFTLPDTKTKRGRRDLALLVLLYDSAARVQEIIDLRFELITLGNQPKVRLTGKGNKTRIVPLMKNASMILANYIKEQKLQIGDSLFFNSRKECLTRAGVSFIIDKYANMAKEIFPNFNKNIHVTPHIFRHSKATHLIECNMNLYYIRDFLGHSSVVTTEIYAKTTPELMRLKIRERAPTFMIQQKKYFSKSEEDDLVNFVKGLYA